MFGLYTVKVKLTYDNTVIAILYRKLFLFRKSAEEYAEDIESIGAGVIMDAKGNASLFKGLITISDRSQEEYFFKKVPCELDVKGVMES